MSYNGKSYEKCVASNDFMSALENLENTTSRWMNYWFECCLAIMENDPRWKAQYTADDEYCAFHPVNEKVLKDLLSVWYYNGKEIFTNGMIDLLDEAEQKCYLFRFFNSLGELVCSKVGTTTKPILIRIKSELRDYAKLDICTCVIDRVYDCGEIPAEGMESEFRGKFIRKYPSHFHKNDRFFDVAFDLEDADRIFAEYFE